MNKLKLILLIIFCFALLLGGCGPKNNAVPQTPPQAADHKMDDPNPIVQQMNQSIDDIEAKSKSGQMAQAKQSADKLVSLNDKLSPHFADTVFKDNLHHAVTALRDELYKSTPNQAVVSNQIQSIKGMLKDAPGKFMKH